MHRALASDRGTVLLSNSPTLLIGNRDGRKQTKKISHYSE